MSSDTYYSYAICNIDKKTNNAEKGYYGEALFMTILLVAGTIRAEYE